MIYAYSLIISCYNATTGINHYTSVYIKVENNLLVKDLLVRCYRMIECMNDILRSMESATAVSPCRFSVILIFAM